ncbi:MAG: hypothetical protein K1Y01_13570, partial [Vicinamibacteria bacterium]|nr:hypothetical protein [Vicinamibacteria bacterium]
MKLRQYLLLCGLLAASCSGERGTPASLPAAPSGAYSPGGGSVSASDAGDVKVGNGALEFIRLRMDRQTPSGASVFRQYALPGETYRMLPGEVIELWAEWDAELHKVPTIIPENPRFTVDWGLGEPESPDFTGCGSCLLKHHYPNPGVYRVTASLNDKNGTVVSRTFFLDSTEARPLPTPSATPTPVPTVTLTIACTGEDCDPANRVGAFYGGSGLITGSGFSCGNF